MRSRLLGWVAVAVLAGCRTVPVQHPPVASQLWDVTRAELQAQDHFALKGRVAVAAGKEGFNASLRWTQEGARSNVSLQGPLGAGGIQISTEGDNLSLVTSHGDRLDSDAARAELVSRLGFDPPLGSLRYWVMGVPDPAKPSKEEVDPQQQRLQSLEQDGWQIDYNSYMPTAVAPGAVQSAGMGVSATGAANAGGGPGASVWLPSRMTVQRAGVRVRLVVDGWSS
jgi:outer membrane lipoprotein LolB